MSRKTTIQQEKTDSLFVDGDFQASEFIYQRILNVEPVNLNAFKKNGNTGLTQYSSDPSR